MRAGYRKPTWCVAAIDVNGVTVTPILKPLMDFYAVTHFRDRPDCQRQNQERILRPEEATRRPPPLGQ